MEKRIRKLLKITSQSESWYNLRMYDVIKNFPKQFAYEPKIENADKFKPFHKFIVAGMGGSHLAADLVKAYLPQLDVIVHEDYGLPVLSDDELNARLIIASSYSGNTEEIIDVFLTAGAKKLSAAAVSIGGKLLEHAKKVGAPYIQLPNIGIQPRSAIGFSFMALLKLMGQEAVLKEAKELAHLHLLELEDYEERGRKLAIKLKNFIPVIYSSNRNISLAYIWKIIFNETAKIPAFYNTFPELNHNEMEGFAVEGAAKNLSKNFYFIFLKDKNDHPKIQKRMEILEKLYGKRKLPVEVLTLEGKNRLHKLFSSHMCAEWTGYYAAHEYVVSPEAVSMIEEFKRLIA